MSSIYPIPPLPPLTAEEQADPFAGFYYEPIGDPDPDILDALRPDNPMPPQWSIGFEDIEQLFRPEGLDHPCGFCLRPDGTGYMSMRVDMGSVTPEMRAFFYTRFLDAKPLYYRIWLPGFHIDHRKPFTESFGWGQGRVCFRREIIPMNSPPDYRALGLSAPMEELDPHFLSVACSSAEFVPLDPADGGFYNVMLGVYKKNDRGGVVGNCVSWFGVDIVDGKPVRMLPEGETMDLEKVRLYTCHQAYEMTRLRDILPAIFAQAKGSEKE